MQNALLEILVLGLLVLLFGAVYRKRATPRLRFWIAGWLFTLAHFILLLPHVANPFLLNLQFSLGMGSLVMTGTCFILASSAYRLVSKDILRLAAVISLPSLLYVGLVCFDVSAVWPLACFATLAEGAAVWLAWRLDRGLLIRATSFVTALACGGWLVTLIFRGLAYEGIYAILMQLFLINAVLLWKDFRRISAGVVTAAAGLLAWAAVFPAALTVAHYFPHIQVASTLWNVPKYFVEFGMLLILLENQVYAANWQREQYRLLFDSNPHPMFIYDARNLTFLHVNNAAVEQYGYSRDEFLQRTIHDLHKLDALPGPEVLLADAGTEVKVTGPWLHRRKDGSEFQAEISSHAIEFESRLARLSMVQDVTERQQLHEQLLHRAHHDSLTNLPNRFLLEQRMQLTLENAARYSHKAAVLCIDLDRFKRINDTYGHAVGDQCLQEVAARLTARLRESDTVARTGGEEFTIVIGELLYISDAETVARDLLEGFHRPMMVGDVELPLSASLGIAIYPDNGTEGTALWRAADLAMYRAKFAGGNRYELASEETSERDETRAAYQVRR